MHPPIAMQLTRSIQLYNCVCPVILLNFLHISFMPVPTQAIDVMSLTLMALMNLVNLHDNFSNRWIVLTDTFSFEKFWKVSYL